MKTTIFKPGDLVTPVSGSASTIGWGKGAVFMVATVTDLSNPNALYVDPFYCDWYEEWKWARGKTRLEVAGHPQQLFFDEFVDNSGSSCSNDPEMKHRSSFSGAWFVLVN